MAFGQVLVHLQGGKAEVDAVQQVEEIAQHQEGHDTVGYFPDRAGFEVMRRKGVNGNTQNK
ncbi:hypothetical protein [Cupriavidus basilensis]